MPDPDETHDISEVVDAMNVSGATHEPDATPETESPAEEQHWYDEKPSLHRIAEREEHTMDKQDYEADAEAVKFLEFLGDATTPKLKEIIENSDAIEKDVEGFVAGLLGSDWEKFHTTGSLKLTMAIQKFDRHTEKLKLLQGKTGKAARTNRSKLKRYQAQALRDVCKQAVRVREAIAAHQQSERVHEQATDFDRADLEPYHGQMDAPDEQKSQERDPDAASQASQSTASELSDAESEYLRNSMGQTMSPASEGLTSSDIRLWVQKQVDNPENYRVWDEYKIRVGGNIDQAGRLWYDAVIDRERGQRSAAEHATSVYDDERRLMTMSRVKSEDADAIDIMLEEMKRMYGQMNWVNLSHRKRRLSDGGRRFITDHVDQTIAWLADPNIRNSSSGDALREVLSRYGPITRAYNLIPELRISDRQYNQFQDYFSRNYQPPLASSQPESHASRGFTPPVNRRLTQVQDSHASTRPPSLTLGTPGSTPRRSRTSTSGRRSFSPAPIPNLRSRYQVGGPIPAPPPMRRRTTGTTQTVNVHRPHSTGSRPAAPGPGTAVNTPPPVYRPPILIPTPVPVRYGARTTIPYTVMRGDRPTVHLPSKSMRDKHRAYHDLHLAQRPLALKHPEKSEPIGKYALVESTGGRYHIEVKSGMPRSAIRRIAHLLFVHAKTRPGAKLNILQNGKERTLSLLKNISRKRLEAIIAKAVATGGGTFVVVHEKAGGALGSKFWRHPSITKLLSRRD